MIAFVDYQNSLTFSEFTCAVCQVPGSFSLGTKCLEVYLRVSSVTKIFFVQDGQKKIEFVITSMHSMHKSG